MAKVQTPSGAQRYGQGIGEEILKDDGTVDDAAPGTSVVRLRSLLVQIAAAERVGDAGRANQLRISFERERAEFASGKTPAQVVAELNAVAGK